MWEIIDEPTDGYEFLDGIFATDESADNFALKECLLTFGEYAIIGVTVYSVQRGFETKYVVEVPK